MPGSNAPRRRGASGQLPTLDRYLTYRLHMLAKLSDRASHDLYLRECGLPLGEARCLACIGSFPSLTVNDLAFQANLDKGQASRAAASLVAQGLARKEASPLDGRSVVLSLTPAGRVRWSQTMKLIDERNAAIFDCLTPDERVLLGQLFDRLLEHARRAPDDQAT
ncbi:MarR family winged helix-turn-helix transcriptional regulator [Ideonella sp. DXS22W]|uniref:MarR family winged helix-turn-helix transcriptional regulator n=1 Tax=Pseudaquabacterium inlustre TaxID=2984192 RepID=A0ABU9CGV7_9BURK